MDPREARLEKLARMSPEEMQAGLDSGTIAGAKATEARAILAKRKRDQDSWNSERAADSSRDDRIIKRQMSRTQRQALIVAIVSATTVIVAAIANLFSSRP